MLRREPFAEILCHTLRDYARAAGHGDVDVDWQVIPIWSRSGNLAADQWLCNGDLNVIFSPRVDPSVLCPIVNEFSLSLRPLYRGLQRYYVSSALHPGRARWFASARLTMRPEWADQHHQIFVPGNQKIRLLDHGRGQCVAIWKSGFPRANFAREVQGRRLATDHHVSVPRLLEVDEVGGWYREEYVTTTPLNRLVHAQQRDDAARSAWKQLQELLHRTTECTSLSEYLDQRIADVAKSSSSLAWLPDHDRQALLHQLYLLREFVIADELQRTIPTAMTHGDFQPANIVIAGHDVWVIDWECCGRRQITYDALVLATGARSCKGLAQRLRQAIHDRQGRGSLYPWLWDSAASLTDLPLRRQVGLFLLEETADRLAEDINPAFPAGGDRLRSFLPTFKKWRKILGTY
jgi:hypothetical protein